MAGFALLATKGFTIGEIGIVTAIYPAVWVLVNLWRDLGYAIGAILTGITADLISINASIIFIGLLTLIAAFIIRYRMKRRINGH